MINSIPLGADKISQSLVDKPTLNIARSERTEIGKRLEQMLWAEMLSHAGLEKAFTQSGGEAASAFSRYIVEAIAEDLADKHPMGIGQSAAPAQHKLGVPS